MTNLSHEQLQKLYEQTKKARQEKFLESCKKRLDQIVSTKIRTSFIGALDVFEQKFGFLWGHGLPEEELTEEQSNFRNVWEQARTEILNRGNTSLRGARTEIANQTISWNRYQTVFMNKGTN